MISSSLLLDPDTWDLQLDSQGNIAIVDNPYAIAQDVACACLTVKGEITYDTTLGIPYFSQILGKPVTQGVLLKSIQNQATRLSTVKSVEVTLVPDKSTRQTKGYIAIIDANGESSTVEV